MPFVRPTLTSLVNRACATINTYVSNANAFIRESVFNVWAKIIAALHLDLYAYQDELARNFFISTADINGLTARGGDIGVYRKKASYASGNISINGTPATPVPRGTKFSAPDEAVYETTADTVIGANGVALVKIIATTTGADGNQDAYTEFSLVNPIVGVDTTAVAGENGIVGGADIEGVEEYRARLLLALRSVAGAGDVVYYENAALSQPGVTRARAFRTYAGPGTVGVTFMMDNTYADGIPTAGDVAAMQEYLESIMPADLNDLVVFAPTPVVVNITINDLNPDNISLRGDINNALAAQFRAYDFGESVFRSQIEATIGSVPGEISHTLAVPTGDTAVSEYSIAILGTITYGVTG